MKGITDLGDNKMVANNVRIKLPTLRSERYDQNYNIKSFGEGNLYPQNLKALITLTPTAAACCDRYRKFIYGSGIPGGDDMMVNQRQTLNDFLRDVAKNMSMFRGCPVHLKFNALGEVVGMCSLPFETIRLGEDDDLGYVRDYAYSPDWSERLITRNEDEINNFTDVVRYFPFASNNADTVARMANSGVQSYAGEIFYLSNTLTYPENPIDSVLLDMSTESGLQNNAYRNARCGFKPSALIAYKAGSEDSNRMFERIIADMVGDETSSGVATVKVRNFDDMPRSLDLKTANYDKEFEVTASKAEERIYAAFNQETFYLLRIGKVGFGGDVMADAFNTMNLCVEEERHAIENMLKRIQKRWSPKMNPFPADLRIGDLLYKKDQNTSVNANNV